MNPDFNRSNRRDCFPFRFRWFTKLAEPAFLERAIRQLQSDLRRPPSFGFSHVFHDADSAGDSVDHDLAEITFTSRRFFGLAHGFKVEQT